MVYTTFMEESKQAGQLFFFVYTSQSEARPTFFSIFWPAVATVNMFRSMIAKFTKSAGRLSREILRISAGCTSGLSDGSHKPGFAGSSPAPAIGYGSGSFSSPSSRASACVNRWGSFKELSYVS